MLETGSYCRWKKKIYIYFGYATVYSQFPTWNTLLSYSTGIRRR